MNLRDFAEPGDRYTNFATGELETIPGANEGTITTDEGVTFEPWTDGWAVGYIVTAPDGRRELIALNPSGGHGGNYNGDESLADTFLYHAPLGADADASKPLPHLAPVETVCFVDHFEGESL